MSGRGSVRSTRAPQQACLGCGSPSSTFRWPTVPVCHNATQALISSGVSEVVAERSRSLARCCQVAAQSSPLLAGPPTDQVAGA